MEHLGFPFPFFYRLEYSLSLYEMGYSPSRDGNVFVFILFIKIDYFQVIGVGLSVKVSKLVSHFHISPNEVNEVARG